MAVLEMAMWPLAGGGLGAILGFAIAWRRRDLNLAPKAFAFFAAIVALTASVFVEGVEAICLAAALAVLSLTDLRRRILPNEITYGLIALGVAFALLGPRDPILAIVGAAVAAAALWSLRAIWLRARGVEALGLGDVKMLAGIGAFLGPYALPEVVFWGAISGLSLAVAQTLTGRKDPEIPFGAALALSAWLYLACGPILFAA